MAPGAVVGGSRIQLYGTMTGIRRASGLALLTGTLCFAFYGRDLG